MGLTKKDGSGPQDVPHILTAVSDDVSRSTDGAQKPWIRLHFDGQPQIMEKLADAAVSRGGVMPLLDDYTLLAGKIPGERKLIEVGPGIGIPFRWCPPGSFTMGSPAREHAVLKAAGKDKGFYADEVPHTVTLTNGFWLAETEVTQSQWQSVMGSTLLQQANKILSDDTTFKALEGKTIRAFVGLEKGDGAKAIGTVSDKIAMYCVNWNEADDFCTKASSHAMLHGWSFALPTEAQWEYACRSSTQGMTYSGDFTIKGENNAPGLDDIAWYGGNSSEGYSGNGWDTTTWKEKQYPGGIAGPRQVSLKQANAWGPYDMLGNVWEWWRLLRPVCDGQRYQSPRCYNG